MRSTMRIKRDLARVARWASAMRLRKSKPAGRRRSAPLWLKMKMWSEG